MSFSFHLCFQPKKPAAIPENIKGSTPKQVAKCLVPEPHASGLCYMRAKKKKKLEGKGEFVLIFL